jgi:hypothetical protein
MVFRRISAAKRSICTASGIAKAAVSSYQTGTHMASPVAMSEPIQRRYIANKSLKHQ